MYQAQIIYKQTYCIYVELKSKFYGGTIREKSLKNNKHHGIREKHHKALSKVLQSKRCLSFLGRRYWTFHVDKDRKSLYKEVMTYRKASGCERQLNILGTLSKNT